MGSNKHQYEPFTPQLGTDYKICGGMQCGVCGEGPYAPRHFAINGPEAHLELHNQRLDTHSNVIDNLLDITSRLIERLTKMEAFLNARFAGALEEFKPEDAVRRVLPEESTPIGRLPIRKVP